MGAVWRRKEEHMGKFQLEDRVKALEAEASQLKAKMEAVNGRTPWWEEMWGAFASDSAFQEAMKLGRQYRENNSRGKKR
jgi:hypothetical protein